MSRRLLLQMLAAGGLLIGSRSPVVADILFFRPLRRERPRVPENVFIVPDKAVVGMSGAGSIEERVREAVELIGGFDRLKIKGKRVLVKPNVVSGRAAPTTTNPQVVAAVVRLLYREGAREVVVGDMSALLHYGTLKNMKKCGIRQAAEGNGARVAAFEDSGWVEVSLPGGRYVKKAYVTEWLYGVDVIVNLPVLKTHHSASYSICMKNFIGCTHYRQRPYLVDASHWEELIPEFNLACRPDLNIVDGTVSMIENGPWQGETAPTGIVIASGDCVAADIVGLGVIRSFGRWRMVTSKDVWDQRQIRHAIALGVGKGKGEIILRSGEGNGRFTGLVNAVRRETGLRDT